MKTILHLSYDYDAQKNGQKTNAVNFLVTEVHKIAKVKVISLDRVVNLKAEKIYSDEQGNLYIQSFGLPMSLLWLANLKRAYHVIDCAAIWGLINLNDIDLIHAHKLTFEGYIGYLLARRLEIPLFVSLRQTDAILLRFRPDLHRFFKKVLSYSTKIFYIVPSLLDSVRIYLGDAFFENVIKPRAMFLPNIVNARPATKNYQPENGKLLTVFRMTKKSVHRKNVKRLFQALAECRENNVLLQVIGDGEYFPVVNNWVNQLRITNQVQFIGPIHNSQINPFYAMAQAFVMPSLSETFGYVYAEALVNGTPILYSRGTGFDGIFKDVGVAVRPRVVSSIRDGLIDIIVRNDFFRNEIEKLIKNEAFRIFSPEYTREIYQSCLEKLV